MHPSPQKLRDQRVAHESPTRADQRAHGFGRLIRELPDILAVILEGVLGRLVDREVEMCAVIVIDQKDSFPVAQKCSELPMRPGGSVDDVEGRVSGPYVSGATERWSSDAERPQRADHPIAHVCER